MGAVEATDHFGTYLRRQREARGLSLSALSRATKIQEAKLTAIEEGRLEALPARVFVIGYIEAYARAVGADPSEAIALLRRQTPEMASPPIGECLPKVVARAPTAEEPTAAAGNRRLGVVLVVFLLLIVASLTLSMLLRHGGHIGASLS